MKTTSIIAALYILTLLSVAFCSPKIQAISFAIAITFTLIIFVVEAINKK